MEAEISCASKLQISRPSSVKVQGLGVQRDTAAGGQGSKQLI